MMRGEQVPDSVKAGRESIESPPRPVVFLRTNQPWQPVILARQTSVFDLAQLLI
jgi:hypothetical protein